MGAQFTAVLDTNVLFDALLRDILLELSSNDLFQARWSVSILDELRRVFERERSDIETLAVARIIDAMNGHTRDCLTTVPDELIQCIAGLPDEGDRHVVAAAIQCRAHAIVTWNVKDFPSDVLDRYRLEAIDPDTFLIAQWDLNQGRFMKCAATVRQRLKKPPFSADEMIEKMVLRGLVATASKLRTVESLI